MNTEKKPSLIDVPILIIFFSRPETLEKVFQQVKTARPSKLYLYQDGPRPNRPDDFDNINKCRHIVENIDWECEVKTLYQDRNFGCDPSEYIAQKWVFKYVDRAIILEDDDVPSQSFFAFCMELLEKYKNDDRINMICGLNHLEKYKESSYDYIFTKSGSITGWASWKRVIDQWDESYNFLSDSESIRLLKGIMGKAEASRFISTCTKHKNSGKQHYESILGSSFLLNSRLNIVPSRNLISNIGIDPNATHGASSINLLPKGIRRIFFMKTYEINSPVKHPKYIIEDVNYKCQVDRILANGYPLIKLYRRVENFFYRSTHGDFSFLSKAIFGFKSLYK